MRRHLHRVSTQLSLAFVVAFVVALVAAPAALATSTPGAIDRRSPEGVVARSTAQQPQSFVVDRVSPEGRGPQGVPTVSVVSVRARDGFDWGDAGIGAGSIAVAALLALAAGTLIVHRRHRPTGKSVLSS